MKNILRERLPFLSPNTSVGQFSNAEQYKTYKVCQAGTFDRELQVTDFSLPALEICLPLKLLLPVSIHHFLPSLADREENIVFCRFIVKLNVNNKRALAKK